MYNNPNDWIVSVLYISVVVVCFVCPLFFMLYFVVAYLLRNSPFFVIMLLLYFFLLLKHVNKPIIFVFGAHFKNTISIFVTIYYIFRTSVVDMFVFALYSFPICVCAFGFWFKNFQFICGFKHLAKYQANRKSRRVKNFT